MNWGTGIALIYGLFACSMVGVVFAARKHDPGLVQKNYYELDLNYQERMERKQNTANLTVQPNATFDANRQVILLELPSGNTIKGSTKAWQLTTYTNDLTQSFDQASPVVEMPAQKMASGRWRLETEWESNGQKYYYETTVTIVRS